LRYQPGADKLKAASYAALQETGEFSAAFTTTQWSEVLDAQQTDPERARAALKNSCGGTGIAYAFICRGSLSAGCEDLTQIFFRPSVFPGRLEQCGSKQRTVPHVPF